MMRARHPALRIALLGLGIVLAIAAPVIGLLPGPGGIFVFAAGLVLILRNSLTARRWFARALRRWPRLRTLADRALRRQSAARRARQGEIRPGD